MKYFVLLSIFVLSACATTPATTRPSAPTDVMGLIKQSEASAPDGIKGNFQFSIKASGMENGTTYLNTELDYRDRRNITLALLPNTIAAFTEQYGSAPDTYFVNKNIEVIGEAKRFKTWFSVNGKRTDKYYFQTHINVGSIDQIKVL
jgi:hypothetical protein